MRTSSKSRAFTLIELLVVIALIAVLAGGIGLAMMGGNSSTALQNSQNVVGSLVSVARSKSALTQADTALLINVTPTSDGFLREFRVAVLTASGPTTSVWVASGDPSYIGQGIYFVVPSSFTSSVDFPASANWNANIRSTAFNTEDVRIYLSDASTQLPDTYRFVQVLTRWGSVVRQPSTLGNPAIVAPVGGRVVLAPAQIGPNGTVTFNSTDALRGMLVSDYGIATLINEPEAFKP